MFFKKLFKIFFSYADVNIIINLNGNPYAISLADTKTTGKCNIIFEVIFFYGFLQKLHDFGRALQMTGASYANLNNHIIYTFDLIFFSKNSATVSGVTE